MKSFILSTIAALLIASPALAIDPSTPNPESAIDAEFKEFMPTEAIPVPVDASHRPIQFEMGTIQPEKKATMAPTSAEAFSAQALASEVVYEEDPTDPSCARWAYTNFSATCLIPRQ